MQYLGFPKQVHRRADGLLLKMEIGLYPTTEGPRYKHSEANKCPCAWPGQNLYGTNGANGERTVIVHCGTKIGYHCKGPCVYMRACVPDYLLYQSFRDSAPLNDCPMGDLFETVSIADPMGCYLELTVIQLRLNFCTWPLVMFRKILYEDLSKLQAAGLLQRLVNRIYGYKAQCQWKSKDNNEKEILWLKLSATIHCSFLLFSLWCRPLFSTSGCWSLF